MVRNMGEVIDLMEAGLGSLAELEKRVDYFSALIAHQHIVIKAMEERGLSPRLPKANLAMLTEELWHAARELEQRERQASLSPGIASCPSLLSRRPWHVR